MSLNKLITKETTLEGVREIFPPTNFEDFRGSYLEIFNSILYSNLRIDKPFIQDNVSISRKDVLRGIHGDSETWKLVSCIQGSLYLIVVNNDPLSRQYKKWESFTLSLSNYRQILVPPKFGIGHLVMSPTAIFCYKQTTEYNRRNQFTIKWNDPEYSFWWPISNPITSTRDQG